jgi:hypothetical protein
VLGSACTRREFCELAVSRALESRGHSDAEIAEMTPEFVALLEEEWNRSEADGVRSAVECSEVDEEPR